MGVVGGGVVEDDGRSLVQCTVGGVSGAGVNELGGFIDVEHGRLCAIRCERHVVARCLRVPPYYAVLTHKQTG